MTHSSQLRCAALACLFAAVPGAFAQDTAKDFAKDVFRDQKQIWTSPFRMKGRDVKWWLIFGAATGALIDDGPRHLATTAEHRGPDGL